MMNNVENDLLGVRIAIELLRGDKIFGSVVKWSKLNIWVIPDGSVQPIKVPRDIIKRRLLLFEGDK